MAGGNAFKNKKEVYVYTSVRFLISDVHVKLSVFTRLIVRVLFGKLQNSDCNVCDAL